MSVLRALISSSRPPAPGHFSTSLSCVHRWLHCPISTGSAWPICPRADHHSLARRVDPLGRSQVALLGRSQMDPLCRSHADLIGRSVTPTLPNPSTQRETPCSRTWCCPPPACSARARVLGRRRAQRRSRYVRRGLPARDCARCLRGPCRLPYAGLASGERGMGGAVSVTRRELGRVCPREVTNARITLEDVRDAGRDLSTVPAPIGSPT
jgi:hypothetical protein